LFAIDALSLIVQPPGVVIEAFPVLGARLAILCVGSEFHPDLRQ
jgi:hypothetical protein